MYVFKIYYKTFELNVKNRLPDGRTDGHIHVHNLWSLLSKNCYKAT